MEDSELTRKAIEELIREMNDCNEKETLPPERKKNPLGKPNKRFLGRTINSMITHNKRQNDRNHKRCQRKLKELDERQKKRDLRSQRQKNNDENSAHEILSSDSENGDGRKFQIKHKNLKRKKWKKTQKSSSASSTSSRTSYSSENDYSTSSDISVQAKYKSNKNRNPLKKKEYVEENNDEYVSGTGMGYYLDPNLAYAAMAYNQMNHILHQQQIVQQEMVKEELEESVEIPSDLSLSGHSESSLNISLNSSSAEEDENGILTFQLSSEDEETVCQLNEEDKAFKIHKNIERHRKDNESDVESVQSIISIESEAAQRVSLKESNEICLLISSGSESDGLEIVERINENIEPLTIKTVIMEKPQEEETIEQFKNLDEEITQNTGGTVNQKSINMENDLKNQIEEKNTNIPMVDLTDEVF